MHACERAYSINNLCRLCEFSVLTKNCELFHDLLHLTSAGPSFNVICFIVIICPMAGLIFLRCESCNPVVLKILICLGMNDWHNKRFILLSLIGLNLVQSKIRPEMNLANKPVSFCANCPLILCVLVK